MNTDHTENTGQTTAQSGRTLANCITLAVGALATLIRLIPHPANFSPVGGVSLFSGGRIRSWVAYLVPLGIMVLSDFGLWLFTRFDPLYSPLHISRLYVYPCFLLYVWLGRALISNKSLWWVGVASVLGGLQFFVITNFFTWLTQPLAGVTGRLYTRDLNGLLDCFVAALPFYQSDAHFDVYHGFITGDARLALFGLLVGDLCFSILFFSLQAGLVRVLAPAPAAGVPASEDGLLVHAAASRNET
jgi:hypothetical protein